MNDLYAIDPDAITNVNHLLGLIEKFRPSEGRFVAKFPNSWIDDIRSRIPKGTLENTRVTEKLKFWASSVIDIKANFHNKQNWLENAIRIQKEFKIFEMILTTKNIDSYQIVELADILERHLIHLKDSREGYVLANAKSYCRVCEPLFQISEEIVIYDYKFSTQFKTITGQLKPDWQRLKVLDEFIKGMVESKRTKRLLIVFNVNTIAGIEELIQTDLDEVTNRADPDNLIEISYHVDDGKFNMASQHPRCIFSVKAGLRFDQGFQEFKTNDSNLVNWMSDVSLNPFRDKFLKYFH
jgi:hypothetical protein